VDVGFGVGLGLGDELGIGDGDGLGEGESEGVGLGVGVTSTDLKVAMQPAQDVFIKFVPEFAVSLIVDILANSPSDKYVPKFFDCPLDNA
jgi:hypothetical protein